MRFRDQAQSAVAGAQLAARWTDFGRQQDPASGAPKWPLPKSDFEISEHLTQGRGPVFHTRNIQIEGGAKAGAYKNCSWVRWIARLYVASLRRATRRVGARNVKNKKHEKLFQKMVENCLFPNI